MPFAAGTYAVFTTTEGKITVPLLESDAPITVANFIALAEDALVGGPFPRPIRLAAGITRKLSLRNSRRILGIPFSEAAAMALVERFMKREVLENGFLYNDNDNRPAQGAFVLTNDDDVEEMFGVLKSLGLNRFAFITPADVFAKPILHIDEDHIAPATVESGLVFQMAKNQNHIVQLIFRVMIMDPMFVDERGRSLNLTRIPAKYVEAVLNSLNPAAYFRALKPEQLDALFARAGKFEGVFKASFSGAVRKWQNRPTPKDLETLRVWMKLLLLHEFTHALALNMPDRIPTDLSQEEQARLSRFSVTAYISLLNGATGLHTSVVYTKNLFKALQAVEGQEVSSATQNKVVRLLALEMFCDRFSMYMFETYRKLLVYHEAVPDMGEITVEAMRKMEKQRLTNLAAFRTVNELTDAEIATLAAKMEEAETEHIYISAFGDPAILDAERIIFEPFLDLIRHFDHEETINTFTEEQSRGDFFKATSSGESFQRTMQT
jgi:hypothetical protein